MANIKFLQGAESVKNYMIDSGLVKVLDIDEHTGNTRKFSEVDTNEYLKKKGESDQAVRGKVQQGYTKTMEAYRVAENLGISYEMKTQNKYPEVINALLSGGAKGYNRIDLDLSHRFTFGTATTYTDLDGETVSITCGDSLQLFYTAHLLRGSATTFRNRLANNPQLSKGGLESMERLAVEETYSQFGEKKVVNHDVLWTTDDPNTVNTAREILRSTASPEAPNAGVTNVYSGKYRHAVLPRVATTAAGATDSTKRRYWGLASSANSSFYLGIWERPHMIAPSVGGNGEDPQTDDLDFRVRAGYGIVTVGATWVKMSSGDAAA